MIKDCPNNLENVKKATTNIVEVNPSTSRIDSEHIVPINAITRAQAQRNAKVQTKLEEKSRKAPALAIGEKDVVDMYKLGEKKKGTSTNDAQTLKEATTGHTVSGRGSQKSKTYTVRRP